MAMACFIKPDLAEARFLSEPGARWTATPTLGEQKPDIDAFRARAGQAADWTLSVIGPKRRLAIVCVDSGGSTCQWLRSPNDEQPVLAATLRTATQDWGDNLPVGLVERLSAPASSDPASRGVMNTLRKPVGGKSNVAAAPSGSPVLAAPLSLLRLYLDELDARGVRVDAVASLWHAMASAWAPGEDTTAVLLHEPGVKTEWCWARGGALLVGGSIIDEHPGEAPSEEAPPTDPAERAAGRMALDWLTWSAHLNTFPSAIVIVGQVTEKLAARLAARWPHVTIRSESADDPVALTIERSTQNTDAAALIDPRRTLVSLTNRPTRARRAQYLWAAAALVCLAGALGALGYRMSASSGAMRAAAVAADEQAKSLVTSLEDPLILQGPSGNLVKILESRLVSMKRAEPVKGPPEPKPIFDEIHRIIDLLTKYEGVRLVQLTLDSRPPISLQLNVPDRRTGEEIRLALTQSTGTLRWADTGGVGTDQIVRMAGTWK